MRTHALQISPLRFSASLKQSVQSSSYLPLSVNRELYIINISDEQRNKNNDDDDDDGDVDILFANSEQEHNLFVACTPHTERPLEFASN